MTLTGIKIGGQDLTVQIRDVKRTGMSLHIEEFEVRMTVYVPLGMGVPDLDRYLKDDDS